MSKPTKVKLQRALPPLMVKTVGDLAALLATLPQDMPLYKLAFPDQPSDFRVEFLHLRTQCHGTTPPSVDKNRGFHWRPTRRC
jgi:hypothetical protein